ncbi:hypothetical protein B0H14DRAFT_161188 [Mycena olivaceomarginata]|nr:hypothetical protein B0H14DRAFT_161188 [Mycena olivaceomarginata]
MEDMASPRATATATSATPTPPPTPSTSSSAATSTSTRPGAARPRTVTASPSCSRTAASRASTSRRRGRGFAVAWPVGAWGVRWRRRRRREQQQQRPWLRGRGAVAERRRSGDRAGGPESAFRDEPQQCWGFGQRRREDSLSGRYDERGYDDLRGGGGNRMGERERVGSLPIHAPLAIWRSPSLSMGLRLGGGGCRRARRAGVEAPTIRGGGAGGGKDWASDVSAYFSPPQELNINTNLGGGGGAGRGEFPQYEGGGGGGGGGARRGAAPVSPVQRYASAGQGQGQYAQPPYSPAIQRRPRRPVLRLAGLRAPRARVLARRAPHVARVRAPAYAAPLPGPRRRRRAQSRPRTGGRRARTRPGWRRRWRGPRRRTGTGTGTGTGRWTPRGPGEGPPAACGAARVAAVYRRVQGGADVFVL